MIELETKDLLSVLAFVSKTVEIHEREGEGMNINHPLEIQHWDTMKDDMKKLLAEFDEKYPSLLPVPNDGIQWKDR
jgi:hypothetical protein